MSIAPPPVRSPRLRGNLPTPRPAGPSWRSVTFLALLAAFVVLTLCVIYRSPLLHLDHDIAALHMRRRWPQWFWAIHTYVMLGQRGPSTIALLPWFIWRAWRDRTPRPLLTLAVALLVLNVSVGVVKLATGRLGPRNTPYVHAIFAGGNIYPSGHVSNAVVLYGVLAMISVRYRKSIIAAATFISLTVGAGTIYLNTHWFTDVLGGWIAGGLVLLTLPSLVPPTERGVTARWATMRRRRDERLHPRRPIRTHQPAKARHPGGAGVPVGARVAPLSANPLQLLPT